jgi:hypothetical protein
MVEQTRPVLNTFEIYRPDAVSGAGAYNSTDKINVMTYFDQAKGSSIVSKTSLKMDGAPMIGAKKKKFNKGLVEREISVSNLIIKDPAITELFQRMAETCFRGSNKYLKVKWIDSNGKASPTTTTHKDYTCILYTGVDANYIYCHMADWQFEPDYQNGFYMASFKLITTQ